MTDRQGPHSLDTENESGEKFEDLLATYVEALDAGKSLDPMDILARHPECGQDLIETLHGFIEIPTSLDDERELGTLGDYTLRHQIGRGGMGVVYEAWQSSMNRQVALKVLPVGVAADRKSFTRFMREAQTAGQLNHPSVVQVYGLGIEQQTPYYAMEYVEGETLGQVLGKIKETDDEAETPFGPKNRQDFYIRLAAAFADVADGLQHAHSKGVIHRDIKPSNLILDPEGRLRILDFGLAHLEGQESLTLSGDVIGTPSYMSPEQARAKKDPIDHRTDIYSLGATMYEALTLKPPFKGKSHQDTLSQIIERDPEEPRKSNPHVPAEFETIVLKCLRKDVADRYGTAEALAQDLRRFVRGDPIEARPQSGLEKLGKHLWLYKGVVTASALILLLIIAGLAVANTLIARARDKARQDLYVSDVRLAMEDWYSGNIARFEDLLDRHVPAPGDPDHRGWEWYYLHGLTDTAERIFTEHTFAPWAVAWNPTRDLIASGYVSGVIKIWSPTTGESQLELEQVSEVVALTWGAHGSRLVSGGRDGVVRIWNLDTRKEDLTLEAGPGSPSVTSAPDGRIATATWDGGVKIWSADGQRKRSFVGQRAAWSPDGKWLAISGFGNKSSNTHRVEIAIMDTSTWKEFARIPAHKARFLAWSTDSLKLAWSHGNQEIKIWNSREPGSPVTLRGHRARIYALDWSAGGVIASAGDDGLIKIWDPDQKEELSTLRGHRAEITDLSWSPDAKRLASGSIDNTVRIWDLGTEQGSVSLQGRSRVRWSPDGSSIAVKGLDAAVKIYKADTFEEIATLGKAHASNRSMSWTSDSRLLSVGAHDGAVRIWELSEGELLFTLKAHKGDCAAVSWRPGSRVLASSGADGLLKIWRIRGAEKPKLLRKIDGRARHIKAISWSPDGDRLTSVAHDEVLRVWDAETGRQVYDFNLHAKSPQVDAAGGQLVDWSPSGDRLAVGNRAGTVFVLDSWTGVPIWERTSHGAPVISLAWNPVEDRLAAGGRDGTVTILNSTTGDTLITLRGHLYGVSSVHWSPDGQRLASAAGGCIRIWDPSRAYDGFGDGD